MGYEGVKLIAQVFGVFDLRLKSGGVIFLGLLFSLNLLSLLLPLFLFEVEFLLQLLLLEHFVLLLHLLSLYARMVQ